MTSVLLMAGGLGLRLRPITEDRPKPMVEVGGKPIIEHTIERLVAQGFRHILISLNYRGEDIVQYFGDGCAWGCRIEYVPEPNAMGTAGALKLLPISTEWPLLVINGDLLVEMDFQDMVMAHNNRRVLATMGVRNHIVDIPYGVCDVRGDMLVGIEEKPAHSYWVNAGVYVMSREVLGLLTPGRWDMPEIFSVLLKGRGHPWPLVYKIYGSWLDVGNVADLNHAQMRVVGK